MIDYRNSESCPSLIKIVERKSDLELLIKAEHPRMKITYNQVRKKKEKYFNLFCNIYNKKCAYCGASVDFNSILLFEVDHYICESSYGNGTDNKAIAGSISNLVFACYACNRGKKDFLIDEAYRSILNPDDSSIAKVFYRDRNYYIKINKEFYCDCIIDFYNKLGLGFQLRRLDYLLLEMNNLLQNVDDQMVKVKLEKSILQLMKKKNHIGIR